MAKQSGYLQRQKEVMQAVMEVSEQTTRQLMLDTLQITMHVEHGWGFDG